MAVFIVGTGQMSPVLRETTATVISNTDCNSFYIGNVVTGDIICSSGLGGRGICEVGIVFFLMILDKFTRTL